MMSNENIALMMWIIGLVVAVMAWSVASSVYVQSDADALKKTHYTWVAGAGGVLFVVAVGYYIVIQRRGIPVFYSGEIDAA